MASTEDEIKSLIRSRFYASKEEVISDALRALIMQRPELKRETASGSIIDKEIVRKPPKEDRMKILEDYVGVVSRKCCNFVTALYPTIITHRPSIDTFCP